MLAQVRHSGLVKEDSSERRWYETRQGGYTEINLTLGSINGYASREEVYDFFADMPKVYVAQKNGQEGRFKPGEPRYDYTINSNGWRT